MRKPEFENILRILKKEKPNRPTLFEFFLNEQLYENLADGDYQKKGDELDVSRMIITAFKNAGYDYATIPFHPEIAFKVNDLHREKSISLNEYGIINDRDSFEKYSWPNPDKIDYKRYDILKEYLPDGMKLIVYGPYGVLENVIRLVGFDQLCFMSVDDAELTSNIFDAVGSILLKHYEKALQYDSVGAIISNDDWGFKTQLMLSPDLLRKYVFPWHRKIVEVAHYACKPAILHSCGNLECIMDEIIDDLKYDGKHSYEDNILPVEDAYAKWSERIAIMGGIDMDYLCRSKPEQIKKRSKEMLERSAEKGSFALGSGNSIPEYVPTENYYAMISTIK